MLGVQLVAKFRMKTFGMHILSRYASVLHWKPCVMCNDFRGTR